MSAEELAEGFSRLFPRAPSSMAPVESGVVPGGDSEAGEASPPALAQEHAARGCHLEITLAPGEVVAAAGLLDQQGFAIDAVTGVDWIAESQMELIYDYFHPVNGLRVAVRARIPRETPEIPTISEVFPGANWHERETHDFFGIRFIGHPDLTPLLLPEDATYHPLRKDFRGE
jgi:NADH-quinone oxidoreductase subunit C